MAALLSPNAKQQFFTNESEVAAGYRLYTYLANSTTPAETYSNRAGTTENTNPIILDARGEATIYLQPGVVYDYVLKTDEDALVWTREDVVAQVGDSAAVVFLRDAAGAVARTADQRFDEDVSVKDFGAVGDGVTDDTIALRAARDYAEAAGVALRWPAGDYVVSESIDRIHSIRHVGEGAILRGLQRFYVNPKAGQSNRIYVSTTGNDGRDGLSPTSPFQTIQAAVDAWANYAKNTAGNWTIDLAAGTYSEGCVIDGITSPTELVIEGKLSGATKIVIIDGTSAALASGFNFNGPVRVRLKRLKVQNYPGASSFGIAYQNGAQGTVDTCDVQNVGFAAITATENCILDIIGNCQITLSAAGQKGLRYYRQSNGSWVPGTGNTISVNGGGFVTDGAEIRDNSVIVCTDGISITNCQNVGLLIRRFSYVELRTATVSNNAVGISLVDSSLYANATGVVTMSGNTANFNYQGFSLPFNTQVNTAIGITGPSAQGSSSNYDMVVSATGQTGLQFLTDSATAPLNIDFNKVGRLGYVLSDHSLRLVQNGADTYRFRTSDFIPIADNARGLGGASNRWSTVYAGTGTINTSDATHKTPVRELSAVETAAAKALSQEIGAFQFLASIAEKGEAAREHIGLTVQRAIEIMESHGLDPFRYGFICYDEWDEQAEVWDEIPERPAMYDAAGELLVPARPAERVLVEPYKAAGRIYSFRFDQLALFLLAGVNARLAAIE